MKIVFDEGGHVLLQVGSLEDLDVVGEAQVEPADALHLIDLSVEVPGVVVALVRLDVVLGRWKLLDEEVFGEQVKLQGDRDGLCARHVEHVNVDLLVDGRVYPRLVFENLDVANAVDLEDTAL